MCSSALDHSTTLYNSSYIYIYIYNFIISYQQKYNFVTVRMPLIHFGAKIYIINFFFFRFPNICYSLLANTFRSPYIFLNPFQSIHFRSSNPSLKLLYSWLTLLLIYGTNIDYKPSPTLLRRNR